MKVFIYIMLFFIVVIMPFGIILEDNLKNKKVIITENITIPSEKFTEPKKDVIINMSPSPIYIIREQPTYKFNYTKMNSDASYLSISNKAPYFEVEMDCGENECPVTFYDIEVPKDKIMSLDSFKGKKVILNFWASWCEPCKVEFPAFQRLYINNKDIVILMINVDDNYSSAQKFVAENKYTMPIVYKTDKQLSYNYNLNGIPRSILIDENGIVKKVKIGYFMPDNGEFEFWLNN